ncbi:MAG: S8 family serine peptidase, partial [candidate division Zixibacteria bacterium]|nr:S8 family serine peptidase [candidate division Zixibacteria bacterium]
MIETSLKILFATLILFAATMPIEAATINIRLQEKIDANPMQFYSAYIVMADNSVEPKLAQSLGLDLYTREAGHAIAVKHLKDKAKASQTDLLEYLGAQSALGHVSSYKGYWIDNVVGVTAKGSLLGEISRRSDVEAIYEIENAPLIVPVKPPSPSSAPAESLTSALKVIGADSMWALGYTGEGRIVCSFDTGIDGTHPALSGSWRGNNGYSWEESWFDPVFGDSVPHTTPIRPQHGTHTMGIMVGHDDATGDTVGVAPAAQWISAAVVDVAGQRLLEAFEWAADPDGNPNTVTDVPDVVSHSWGYRNTDSGCEDVFWGAIDNLEALGAVCIFAAGNDGGGSTQQSIRNPANRASSPYNTFAVGMIDPTEPGFPVFYQSSRGPSDCDGVSLKPQVAAPGVNIWSTVPVINGSYNYNTGTSMACPHVAAAVALLRQYNPNAPVDSIKKALMETAIDIEEPGVDFTSGKGLIYIPAALEALAPNNAPNVFISTITNQLPDPGDIIEITVSLSNSGLGLADVIATLRSENPDAVVTDSSFFFGNISMGGEANNDGSPFEVIFDVAIISGTDISLTLHITGSDSYAKDIPLVFTVGEKAVRSTFVHDIGNVSFGASNYGIYGFAHLSVVDLELPGFTWPNDGSGENNLFEMGLLIAADENHVSDNVRNPIYQPDNDFEVSPGGDLQFLEPGPDADEESFSIFDDSRAEHPIGVRI